MRLFTLLPLLAALTSEAAIDRTDFGNAPMKVLIVHSFTRGDAHARVQMLLDYWGKRFGLKSEWEGEKVWIAGQIYGVRFRGRLEIGDGTVSAEATDPGMFFRGGAADYVKKKLRKYLHPQYLES